VDIEPEVLPLHRGHRRSIRRQSEAERENPTSGSSRTCSGAPGTRKAVAREPLHPLGLGGRHIEDRVCLDSGGRRQRGARAARANPSPARAGFLSQPLCSAPVSRAASGAIHVLQRSLPREPDEAEDRCPRGIAVFGAHSAVEEEPGDVVESAPERRRLATADADDVQIDARPFRCRP